MYRHLAVSVLAVFCCSSLVRAAEKPPIKVFILAGQSNMEGKAKLSVLEHQVQAAKTRPLFKHFQNDQGAWIVRDDVWIKFLGRHGGLTVGYGSPDCIGPELAFGNIMGDHYSEPVLLIKTAWGGKSLYRDFRPPSAGLPSESELAKELAQAQKKRPATTLAEIKNGYGAYYRQMLEEISGTLAALKKLFPQYEDQGYELAGFVWFQGFNDMINPQYVAAYAENLAHFIRDVRTDLKSPQLPIVIGVLGQGGVLEDRSSREQAFRDAQASPGQRDEFRGNVAVVQTAPFWDQEADAVFKKGWREHLEEWNAVGSDFPYHYLGSPKTFCQMGNAFAEAMLKLQPK